MVVAVPGGVTVDGVVPIVEEGRVGGNDVECND